MKIILDTNFLIESLKYKIDSESQLRRICDFNFKICLLDRTLEELKKINSIESRMALSYSRTFHIIDTKEFEHKSVDEILIEISSPETLIATQDKELKKELRKKNIPIIVIRQKKYYKFE